MSKHKEILEEIEQRQTELAKDIRDLVRCLNSEECPEIKNAIIDIRIDKMLKNVRCIQTRGRQGEKMMYLNVKVKEIMHHSKLLRDKVEKLERQAKKSLDREAQNNAYKRAFKDVICDHIGIDKYMELANYAKELASEG